MKLPNVVRQKLHPIKLYLKPIVSSAKFKRFFPLMVIAGTIAITGSTYALYQTFALNGGRVTVTACFDDNGIYGHDYRIVYVRANLGTQVEAYVYPRGGVHRSYKQVSSVSDGRATFNYLLPVDADAEFFGISGKKVYFGDKAVIAGCADEPNAPQPSNSGNSSPLATEPAAPSRLNPDGTDCHSYTLQYDPNYSYPCVSHLQNDLGIGSDGVFGPGTLNSVRAFQANNGLTPDGVVGPATWCKIHDDLCGGSAPVASAPTPAAPDKQNPEGTDCHTYTLKYDPNYEYPCVRHLQNDLGIYADGIFGSNTQAAVKNFQSRHDLTPDGVVGPATWCKIHDDLCGGSAPAPTPAATIQGVQGRIFRDDNGNGSLDNGEKLIGNCGGGLDIDASVSANGETRNADDCNPGPFYRINTPAGGQTVSVNPPAGWSSTNGNTRNVTVQAGKYYDVGPWFGIRPTSANNSAPVNTTNGAKAITGVGSNRCLDVAGINRDNGGNIHIWDCHGGSNQMWNFLSNNTIQVYGNKCLDVAGNNRDNGASVITWDCHGGTNQQWTRNSDGTIRSSLNGKCLDVEGYGTGNGSRVQLWDCHGNTNQKWRW